MATTNGRPSPAYKLPVKNLAMYQAKAQIIFDRAGFK
jgi:hypothetical protein